MEEDLITEVPNEAPHTLRDVFLNAIEVEASPVKALKFFEDVSVQTGTDRYILLTNDSTPPIFQVSGILTNLNATAAGAVQHRRPGSKVDEYTARLRIDDDTGIQSLDEDFRALIELLRNTKKACENIAVSSGLVERRKQFKLEEVIVKVSSYSNNVLYFNRKVATREAKPDPNGSDTPDFMRSFPNQGADYPALRYPNGWHLNPLIPVSDNEGLDLNPEHVELPRNSTVYFEIKQGCYNFEGVDGPVKQIVLIPAVIAIKIHAESPVELKIAQGAKRRRLSC